LQLANYPDNTQLTNYLVNNAVTELITQIINAWKECEKLINHIKPLYYLLENQKLQEL